jgi:hypothetical protein
MPRGGHHNRADDIRTAAAPLVEPSSVPSPTEITNSNASVEVRLFVDRLGLYRNTSFSPEQIIMVATYILKVGDAKLRFDRDPAPLR